jgi:hypothetical protein
MRNTLLASAAVLGFALALPAFAQTATDPNPANASAPAGDQTNAAPAPSSGASMGTAASGTESNGAMAAPAAPSTTPDSTATPADSDTSTGTMKPRHHAMSSNEGSGHWAHQPGTGESGPASSKASNIDSADTRSVIAPHLPSPGAGKNAGPERYLEIADRALRAHKTGEAQQALEMAETRLLDRSTAPSDASQPDQNPRIAAVTSALKSLAAKDWEGARKNIREAMNNGGADGMASDSATSSGGMASGTTAGGTGTSSGRMSSTSSSTGSGMGTTSTMAPNSTSQGVAGGNAGASPAPMDPSAQGPASAGAAGTPTTGVSATAPNQMQPANGAK